MSRVLRWSFPLVLAASAQAQAPRAVTLAEAVGLAARVDPNVVQAQGGLRSAVSAVRSARAQFLPNLSASASGGSSFSEGPDRVDPITGQLVSGSVKSQSVNLGLSSDLELFTGFRRGGDLRNAQGREDAAEAAVTEALAQSRLQVSGDFFSALQSRELIEARRRRVARAEQQLAIAVARLQTRAATVADSLRAVVQLGDARLALASEEASLARAEASLARRLGLTGRVAATGDGALEVPGTSLDTTAILAEATARAPAVVRREASVRAAEGALSAAKAAWWPRLTLSGAYNFNGNQSTDYQLFNDRRVSLAISYPLFNRFQRNQTIDDRSVALETERAQLADARRQVAAELTTQFAALGAALQRIELTRVSVAAAQADVTVALERYRLGSISITELNAAEDGLTRAEESAVAARFEYLRAKAQIEALIGRPL